MKRQSARAAVFLCPGYLLRQNAGLTNQSGRGWRFDKGISRFHPMSGRFHVPPKPPLSGLAHASLVCGVLGFFTVGLTGVIAVILGHMALHQISRSCGGRRGREMAMVGLVTGYLGALLVIQFGFMMYRWQKSARPAKYRQVNSDFKSFRSALHMYRINARVYPSTAQGLGALVTKPSLAPEPEKWAQVMTYLPVDPWGHAYDYRFPGRRNPDEPEIICAGQDAIMGTADDRSSQEP